MLYLEKPVVSQIKEIYLIIKDIVMYEKYTRQIGVKICNLDEQWKFSILFIKYKQKPYVDSNLWSAVHKTDT